MKKLNKALLLTGVILSTNANSALINYYRDANYSHQVDLRNTSFPTYKNTINYNDQLSSISIEPGNGCVLMAKDHTFKGDWLFTDSSIANLHSFGFNDVISSWVAFDTTTGCNEGNIAVLFYDANGGGGKFPAVPNSYNSDMGYFNDEASSIYIPYGITVTLFEHSAGGGEYVILTGKGTIYNLENYRFNDKVSSFNVTKS